MIISLYITINATFFRSKSCQMVCLSVTMSACSPIHSPVRSLLIATGTPASRALWAASTSAPRTWPLTPSEAGVTGSMRLSALMASQPRGYKPGEGEAEASNVTSRVSQWSAVIIFHTG